MLMSSFSTAYFIFLPMYSCITPLLLPSNAVLCSFRRKGATQDMSTETVLASGWLSFPHVHFADTSDDRKQCILTPAGAMVLHRAAVNHLSTGSSSWNVALACVTAWCWIWEVIIRVNFSPVDVIDATLMEGHTQGFVKDLNSASGECN